MQKYDKSMVLMSLIVLKFGSAGCRQLQNAENSVFRAESIVTYTGTAKRVKLIVTMSLAV